MTDDIRRRAACDRCHSQKIRCPRQPGQTSCSRCVKSGSQCIFSPFRQKKTPSDWSPESAPDIHDTGLDNLHSAVDLGTSNSGKRRRVGSDSAISQNREGSTPQVYEPFNVDDMGLDWTPNGYPFPQDLIDPSFCQVDVNFGYGSSNMFSLQEDSPTPSIVSLLNNDIDILGQTRKQTNAILPINHATYPERITEQNLSDAGTILGRNVWHGPDHDIKLDSINDCVKKLSLLSSDLYEHKQTIPPLSIHDPDSVNSPKSLNSGVDDYSKYVVEETFRLTQTLIDLYPTFLKLFVNHHFQARFLDPLSPNSTSPSSATDSSPSNSSDTTTPEDTTSTPRLKSAKSKQPLDHPSILLLTSCHLRIIEIYNELFAHMAVCIRQKGIVLTRHQAQLKTPQLSIGSYVPPPSSAVPMQMLLLVQFASQLSAFANDLDRELEGLGGGKGESGDREDGMMKVTRVVVGNVSERAEDMAKELSRLRGALLNAGILA